MALAVFGYVTVVHCPNVRRVDFTPELTRLFLICLQARGQATGRQYLSYCTLRGGNSRVRSVSVLFRFHYSVPNWQRDCRQKRSGQGGLLPGDHGHRGVRVDGANTDALSIARRQWRRYVCLIVQHLLHYHCRAYVSFLLATSCRSIKRKM